MKNHRQDGISLQSGIVARRQYKVDPQDKESDFTTELKVVLAKRPKARARWLQRCLTMVSMGELNATTLYDIITHSKFGIGFNDALRTQTIDLLKPNLWLFSPKQQKVLWTDAIKPKGSTPHGRQGRGLANTSKRVRSPSRVSHSSGNSGSCSPRESFSNVHSRIGEVLLINRRHTQCASDGRAQGGVLGGMKAVSQQVDNNYRSTHDLNCKIQGTEGTCETSQRPGMVVPSPTAPKTPAALAAVAAAVNAAVAAAQQNVRLAAVTAAQRSVASTPVLSCSSERPKRSDDCTRGLRKGVAWTADAPMPHVIIPPESRVASSRGTLLVGEVCTKNDQNSKADNVRCSTEEDNAKLSNPIVEHNLHDSGTRAHCGSRRGESRDLDRWDHTCEESRERGRNRKLDGHRVARSRRDESHARRIHTSKRHSDSHSGEVLHPRESPRRKRRAPNFGSAPGDSSLVLPAALPARPRGTVASSPNAMVPSWAHGASVTVDVKVASPWFRVIQIPAPLAGALIGHRGARITELRQMSGADIRIDQPKGNELATVSITGKTADVAERLIYDSLGMASRGALPSN